MRIFNWRYRLILGVVMLVAAALLLLILIRDLLTPPQPSGMMLIPDAPNLLRLNVAQGQVETFPFDKSGIHRALQMVISPDRRWLAFAAADDSASTRIYIAALDGSQARPLTDGPVDMQPQWSPDGQHLVFTRSISPRSALFGVNVETGEQKQLTDYANDLEPSWSPDGERIVFTTSRDGFQELYSMSPDGSDVRRLTENEGVNDLQGVYSPDGEKIAYITNRAVGDDSAEIWVMNADGSDQRQVTALGGANFGPSWSPDGTKIIFSTNFVAPRSGNFDLYLVDANASMAGPDQVEQITFDGVFDGFPIFHPNGKQLLWASNRFAAKEGETNLFVADFRW